MLRMVAAVTLLFVCSICTGCTTEGMDWTTAQAEPFTISVQYPAALFPNGFLSRAQHDAEWFFGPYSDGASLLLQARIDKKKERPYQAACATDCANETFHLDRPTLGISTGRIGQKIYYSKCVRRQHELHCLHVIYPAVERQLYAGIVARMSATLQ